MLFDDDKKKLLFSTPTLTNPSTCVWVYVCHAGNEYTDDQHLDDKFPSGYYAFARLVELSADRKTSTPVDENANVMLITQDPEFSPKGLEEAAGCVTMDMAYAMTDATAEKYGVIVDY